MAGSLKLLQDLYSQLIHSKVDDFGSLRDVDAKVTEADLLFESITALPGSFIERFRGDPDFTANSRRVRLAALTNYCATALKFAESGSDPAKPKISRAPDLSRLTVKLDGLQAVLERRWLDAQKCQHARCYLAAVVLMGSILEGLLLSRVLMDLELAFRSPKAPRKKDGKNIAPQDWGLAVLLDVAVDRGWLKIDRGKFGHALRESRNVVHPWQEVAPRAEFDEATCATSWQVLRAAVGDLLASV